DEGRRLRSPRHDYRVVKHGPTTAAAIVASLLAIVLPGCRRDAEVESRPAATPGPTRQPPAPIARSVPTPGPAQAPPPTASVAIDPARLQAAVAQVEEPRGRRGRITVSPQLRLYEDSRRFLALQMADS